MIGSDYVKWLKISSFRDDIELFQFYSWGQKLITQFLEKRTI